MCIVSTVWDSLLTLLYCFSPQSRTQTVTLPLTLAGSGRLDETRHHVLCSQGSMMGGPCNGSGTTIAEE